jgi:hypothetical protein
MGGIQQLVTSGPNRDRRGSAIYLASLALLGWALVTAGCTARHRGWPGADGGDGLVAVGGVAVVDLAGGVERAENQPTGNWPPSLMDLGAGLGRSQRLAEGHHAVRLDQPGHHARPVLFG